MPPCKLNNSDIDQDKIRKMSLRKVKKPSLKIKPKDNLFSIEQFFKNQGLAHIGENILTNLDHASLISCRNVCQNWKNLIDNPYFMLKACKKKASKSQSCSQFYHQWIKLIVECQDKKYYYDQDVIFLLKTMHQDMTTQEKQGSRVKILVKSPIHMALKVQNKNLLRDLLLQEVDQAVGNGIIHESDVEKAETVLDIFISALIWKDTGLSQRQEMYAELKDEKNKILKFLIGCILTNFPSTKTVRLYMEKYDIIFYGLAGLLKASCDNWKKTLVQKAMKNLDNLNDLEMTRE